MTSILFVESYPQVVAGQQETLTALLGGCPAHGISPTIAMPRDGVFADRLRVMGHHVKILPQPALIDAYGGALYRYGLGTSLQLIRQVASYAARLRRWMKGEGFAAVYVNDMRALLTFGIAARSLGLPVLLWDKLDKPHGLYDTLQLPLVTRNLMISQAVAVKYPAWQRQLWRNKMKVVRDGIDLSRFMPGDRAVARAKLGIEPGEVAVAIVGTVCERKGHDRLLAAFKRARNRCPNLTLTIIGGAEPETEEFAAHLRMESGAGVRWFGRRDDLPDILPAIDFLVSPSRHEGMGRVNVEAMACALPVIGAVDTGIAEVVTDGETGLLVDAANIQALGDAILTLAADPELRSRMGKAGLHRAWEAFDGQCQIGQVLTELVSLGRQRA